MKAIVMQRTGGPEVLELREVPAPEPGPGQIRVRQDAIGVNYIDIYHRTGLYPVELPLVVGQEGAGVVDALGPGTTGLGVGDRVAYATAARTYAEQVCLAADNAVPVPRGVSQEQAAAVLLQGMTAHYLVTDTAPLGRGDTVLVHAAAGGVGALLVQAARLRGARVIATVGSEEKAAVASASGAHEVIVYTRQDFEAEVKRLTSGAGVRVVYDSVGKDTFAKSLNCLSPRGILVSYGQSSGKVEAIEPVLLSTKGSLYLTRPTLRHYVPDAVALRRRAAEVFGWVARNKLAIRVHHRLPLERAAEAHTLLASRGTIGKIILVP